MGKSDESVKAYHQVGEKLVCDTCQAKVNLAWPDPYEMMERHVATHVKQPVASHSTQTERNNE